MCIRDSLWSATKMVLVGGRWVLLWGLYHTEKPSGKILQDLWVDNSLEGSTRCQLDDWIAPLPIPETIDQALEGAYIPTKIATGHKYEKTSRRGGISSLSSLAAQAD
eukprot:TRINITY_DN3780_c0_g1_i2.p1 TRINITY_DN3780_c0_g1~~TRINITY_DN3780_c0_g1_i2.p1  ORF type:complete len:107 (-),score=18.21 TRINITY_DN3780_c0_g1_i2:92-412(-)